MLLLDKALKRLVQIGELTIVDHDARALGRVAAEMLLDRADGLDGPPRVETLPVELRVVKSA